MMSSSVTIFRTRDSHTSIDWYHSSRSDEKFPTSNRKDMGECDGVIVRVIVVRRGGVV